MGINNFNIGRYVKRIRPVILIDKMFYTFITLMLIILFAFVVGFSLLGLGWTTEAELDAAIKMIQPVLEVIATGFKVFVMGTILVVVGIAIYYFGSKIFKNVD